MIHDQDRSGWFGASDTARVMGSLTGKTFEAFWLEKLGIRRSTYKSAAMKTGTAFEGKILDFIGAERRDRQIRIRSLRLRVNLDGEDSGLIHEVKTHKDEVFKISRPYWMQAQVEMFAAKKPLEIVSYRLLPEDYDNWYREIDKDRLARQKVPYDHEWVIREYIPRLEYLADCLRRRVWPGGST